MNHRLYALHLKLSVSSHNTNDTNSTTSQPTTTHNTEQTNLALQLTLDSPVRLMVKSSSVVLSDYESAQRTSFLHSRRQRSTGWRQFNMHVFREIRQLVGTSQTDYRDVGYRARPSSLALSSASVRADNCCRVH